MLARARLPVHPPKLMPTPSAAPTKARRTYSAEAKARMAAGAKARWAKVKSGQAAKATAPAKPKRKLSAEGRANIIAATNHAQ